MNFEVRMASKHVQVCSFLGCEKEVSDWYNPKCLRCDVSFCWQHRQGNIEEVQLSFVIQARDPSSSGPASPIDVAFCSVCKDTPEAKLLIEAYGLADWAVTEAGKTVMPVIEAKYKERNRS